jgi:tetratricopeptide (TPR) repeat protein
MTPGALHTNAAGSAALSSPDHLWRCAVAACVAGDLPEGERLLRLYVVQKPGSADGWFNLGKVLRDGGNPEEAVAAYRTAARLAPRDPLVLYNLGNVLLDLCRPAEAIAVYRQARMLDPHLPGLNNNLGRALEERGDLAGALLAFTCAVSDAPYHAAAQMHHGHLLLQMGRPGEAEESYRRAVAAAPAEADAHYNLAGALLACDRYEEADHEFAEALRLRPAFPEALVNRGIGFLLTERTDEAISVLRTAVDLRPDFAEAHLNLAVALLQQGEYEAGWQEYAWRFRTADGKNPRRHPEIPEWQGEPLDGMTLLIYQEQGMGDILQCVRFVPALIRMGARVVIDCQSGLHRLLRFLPDAAILSDAHAAESAGVDLVCPVFSLPRILGITPSTVPAHVPYLKIDPDIVARWRRITGANAGELRVGLAWAGNPAHSNNRRRSLPEELLTGILSVPGVEFHSLHTSAPAVQHAALLRHHGAEVGDLGEVAGLMSALDLVITIDTSFAHLAGGLGLPVWLLLNFGGDWRWMQHSTDTPWYPSMRIFRQHVPGDWPGVMARVEEALCRKVGRDRT